MSNDVITVGSATSTGGKVVSGNSGMVINNKPIALVGDMATCACPNILVCRRQGVIVAMSPRNANVNGTLFAKAGDLVDTGCGSCFLLPSEHGVSLGADVGCSLNVGSGISFGNGVNINQSSNTPDIAAFSSQNERSVTANQSPSVVTQPVKVGPNSNTGEDLILAIENNSKLMALSNCPAVPVEFSRAVYGSVQDDSGNGSVIENKGNMQRQINIALAFSGANSETEVWHFLMGSAVHHFVVVPWYKQSVLHGVVYTIFMAYEDEYKVDNYVHKIIPAPTGAKGYKQSWTTSELSNMFSDLLTKIDAWESYFGSVGNNQANKITYWKYKTTTLSSAITNVNKY